MSRHDVLRAANEAGLGGRADWLASNAKLSIRLDSAATAADEHGSHLGGDPLLPADFDWPSWRDVPMSFIAQINLSEFDEHVAITGLPSHGVLSFFYDSAQSTWGFDPTDAGSALVKWFPDTSDLTVRPIPSGISPEAVFRRVEVAARREWTVPQFGSIELTWKGSAAVPTGGRGDPIELEEMMRLEKILGGAEFPRHRMLGYPDQMQEEMRTECELVTNGIYTGNSSYRSNPRITELEANGSAWQLLLQVDSDEDLGTMWGDGGRIYYWIREDALRARRFDRSWLILQCM